MSKFITPDEQRKNRLKAQREANKHAMHGLGKAAFDAPPPTLTIKSPTKYSEPADVISIDQGRDKK